MASGTCDDALINPMNTNRQGYQYPQDSQMDYQNFPDENGNPGEYEQNEADGYDQGEMEGYDQDERGTEGYGQGQVGTEGYGQGELEGYGPGYDQGEEGTEGYYEGEEGGYDPEYEQGEGQEYDPNGVEGGQYEPEGTDEGYGNNQEFGENEAAGIYDENDGYTQEGLDTGQFEPGDDPGQFESGEFGDTEDYEETEFGVETGQEDEAYNPDNEEEGGDDELEESEGEESDEEEEEEDEEEDDAEEAEQPGFDTSMGLEDLLADDNDNPFDSQDNNELTDTPTDNRDVPMADTGISGEQKPAEGQKKKRKRRKKDEAPTGEKPKRKRKKKEKKEGDEDGKKKKVDQFARRNIRKIITERALEKDTLDAQAAELERQKRLAEIKKTMLKQQTRIKQELEEKKSPVKQEKDSQLKSLLQSAEEEAEKQQEDIKPDINLLQKDMIKAEDIKHIKDVKPLKKDAIEISSGEDDSDVVMVKSEEEEDDLEDEDAAEDEDLNNGGSHINDSCNIKEKDGRVLVNVSHPTADPDIYLPVNISDHIKPHQIGGVRFLYDNLIECINRFKTSNGFGCILAHSMGLGKTIQVIGFTDIFLNYTGAKSVLIIVPINTLANWMAEFNMWVPDQATLDLHNYTGDDIKPRTYQVYMLNDLYKNTPARSKVVEKWHETGGVLLMGYEMYRLLSSKKPHLQKQPKSRKKGSQVIDVDEEDRDKTLLVGVYSALVNPGPDLVVCDEGHRIKNAHAGISQSLKNIKTKRRIVLTGYPLQNNLLEYWCMVDFVRPNFLGTKTEFSNMFERPIMNGQCADSTPQDVRLMRYRAHVLHSLLEGFVQRRGHTVLKAALPPKEEYVFMVQMSDIQKQLYKKFMDSVQDAAMNGWVNNNPLKAFAVCCKIWNHPDILYNVMKKATLDDNDLDLGDNTETKKRGGRGKGKVAPTPPVQGQASATLPGAMGQTMPPLGQVAGQMPGLPTVIGSGAGPGPGPGPGSRSSEPNITYDWVRKESVSFEWATEIMKDYQPGLLSNGGKFVLLFNLIQEALAMEDKVLVFSQSLFTLNLIEDFLAREKVPRWDMDEYWSKNKNYFRLDGSTSSTERERMINVFNQEDNNQHWLFLLSTRAGSLGVNLIGANRVIVLDASWNPCHDCQAICRVYRFGQMKPTFIYRFVTENTMERKIYDRQINKQGMSDRVVDELNPQNQFKKEQVENILLYNEREFVPVDFSNAEQDYTDIAMAHVLQSEGKWLTAKPFTHESLLIDRKELKLTLKEKRLAKQSYVMEKRLNVSYSRPSYSQFYPKNAQTPYQGMIRGRSIARPIASVKPMISTPVPMKPKIISAPQVLKPGVSVHQVLTTTEIVLPGTNTTTEAGKMEPKKIPAGQQVLVIRTPKGVYIRTPDGKIFAVRSKPQPNSTSPLDKLANTGSNVNPGGGGAVTIIRPTLTTSTRPMAIVTKEGGMKMVVPISTNTATQGRATIAMTTGTASSSTLTMAVPSTLHTQSQKVNSLLQSGAQIRIVRPNFEVKQNVPPLSALQTLSTSTRVVSNGPSLSGSNLITKKLLPKPAVASVQLIKKTVSLEPMTNSSVSASSAISSEAVTKTTDSWNLKPINVTAIKNPLQGQLLGNTGQATTKAETKVVASVGQFKKQESDPVTRPTFGLPESPGSSSSSQSPKPAPSLTPPFSQGPTPQTLSQSKSGPSLPMRPSDIDLHELQLSGNSGPISTRPSDIDLSAMQLGTGGKKEKKPRKPRAKSSKNAKTSKKMASQSNTENLLTSSQGVPANLIGTQGRVQSSFQGQGMLPSNQTSNKPSNQRSSPFASGSQGNMQSDLVGNASSTTGSQNMSNTSSEIAAQPQGMETETEAQGGEFMRMMSNEESQDDDSLLADFSSNIQNNSSFLSELNLTEAEQNFMSQHVYDNSQSNTNNNGSNQMGNTNPGMGMPGFGSGRMSYQQPNMNFDMFGNAQNTGYNFPNFGGGPYQNSSYLGNQAANQNMPHSNSYPGSMYPMMQPGMYGYPPYPYPYPAMMPPMPFYPPMPMHPQYGQGAGNMGQMNMPQMTGDGQTNMGNSAPVNNNNSM